MHLSRQDIGRRIGRQACELSTVIVGGLAKAGSGPLRHTARGAGEDRHVGFDSRVTLQVIRAKTLFC